MHIPASPFLICISLAVVLCSAEGFDDPPRLVEKKYLMNWGELAGAAIKTPWTPLELGTVQCQIKASGKYSKYTFFKVNFEASFNITYEVDSSTLASEVLDEEMDNVTYATARVNVPTINSCMAERNEDNGCTQINATFTWDADGTGKSDNWSLLLTYQVKKHPKKGDLCQLDKQNDWDSFEYYLQGMELSYNTRSTNYFPNAKDAGDQVAENWDMDLFEVESDSSYKCDTNSSFAIEKDVVVIFFKDYQSQAFQFEDSDKADSDYDTAKLCSADDDGSSLVPIIVGCVLAGLIILTLVAYFIGRWHQNRQESYQAL